MIFRINNKDMNQHIVCGSYKVNKQEVFNSWTDGNKVEHRDVVRSRVAGTCSLHFSSQEEYNSFLTHMEQSLVRNGGYYNCEITVNNMVTTHTGQFFIDFEPIKESNATDSEMVEEFELNIQER